MDRPWAIGIGIDWLHSGWRETHPGGPQALAQATKGGVKLAPPKGTNLPLAGSNTPVPVILRVGQLQIGQNWLRFDKVDVMPDSSFRLRKGSFTEYSAKIKFSFPKAGWYLINIEGAIPPGASVSARIRQLGQTIPGPAFQTWKYPTNNGSQSLSKSFPAVFEYKGSASRMRRCRMSRQ